MNEMAEAILHNAIAECLQGGDGEEMLLSFFVIAEVLTADGERVLHTYWDDESAMWHRIGMLRTSLLDQEKFWSEADEDD